MSRFWKFSADGTPKLYLYGAISDSSWFGDEVTPGKFRADLEALGDIDALELHVNSPGGDVFAGQALYSILRNHKATITGYVDGVAASIASVVLMAADRIVMPANATMMVHAPWTAAVGNSAELRSVAEALDQAQEGMISAYAARTKLPEDEIRSMMAAETWMPAAEAKRLGFADEVQELARVKACLREDGAVEVNGQVMDLSRYQHPPVEAIVAGTTVDSAADPGEGSVSPDEAAAAQEEQRRRAIASLSF